MTQQKSERSPATLTEMAMRGKEYREDYSFELYGEEVEVVLKPLTDEVFLPLMAELAEALGVEPEELQEGEVDEKIDDEYGDEVAPQDMNDDFVDAMQKAAVSGLYGQYNEDGEVEELSTEKKAEVVNSLMGGASVELGSRVMEVSGDIRDVEKFPASGES